MRHRLATLALLFATPLLAQGRPNPESVTEERWRGRVVFLIDATSSMRIGDRFAEARELVEELQGELHRSAKFDLVLFHTTNEELYESCKSATPDRLERSRAWLAKAQPKATAASPIAHAVKLALRRKPDRIVLISDGVLTPGLKRSEYAKLEKLVRKADRKLNIDTYAVQSGRYGPNPALEDLGAGLNLLQSLATWSGGTFAVTSAPAAEAPRLPVADARPPVVNLLKFKDARLLPPQVPMGQLFRVRVDDAELAELGWAEVPEYGSPVSLQLTVIDPSSRIEVDRSPLIALRRNGAQLIAARAFELYDAARRLPKGARRALPLRARPGDLVIATYTRGDQRAQAQVWIQEGQQPVLIGGSVAPCTCCSGGARPLRPAPVRPRPVPAGTDGRSVSRGGSAGRPVPRGVGGSTITGGGPSRVPTGTITGGGPSRVPTGTITGGGPSRVPTGTITGGGPSRVPTGTITGGGPSRVPTGGYAPTPTTGSQPTPRPVTGSPQPARPVTGSPQPARPVTGSGHTGCACGCH